MVLQVGDTRRPSITIDPYDVNTVPLIQVVSSLGVVTTPALSGPVVNGTAGTWTATASYTLNAPGRWYELMSATNAVTGVGAGTAAAVALDVEGTPPPYVFPDAWATAADYALIIGGTIPTDISLRLYAATLQLRTETSLGAYIATDQKIIDAKKRAAVLQARYAIDNNLPVSGSGLVLSGQIGSVRIDVGKRADGAAGGIPLLDPLAMEVLTAAGMAPDTIDTDIAWVW